MVIEHQIEEHEKRIAKLETCMDSVEKGLARIQGSQTTVETLIKWVIVPLIIILGGLVGIKIAWPG